MYGYVSDCNQALKGEIALDQYDEFEQLKSEYPEHEVYLFLGTDVDMAIFTAPGVTVILIHTRASP